MQPRGLGGHIMKIKEAFIKKILKKFGITLSNKKKAKNLRKLFSYYVLFNIVIIIVFLHIKLDLGKFLIKFIFTILFNSIIS